MQASIKTLLQEYQLELHIANYAKTTYKLYYDLAKNFLECLPNIESLNRDSVESYLSKYKGQSTASRNQKTSSMRRLLRFLKSSGYENAQIRLHDRKVGRKLPDSLTEEDMQSVLLRMESSIKNWIDHRNYALVLFLYATGARISEALSVAWIDIEDGWIRINAGKGNKDRYVPIYSGALEVLEAYKEACPFELIRGKPIFTSYQGGTLSRISAYKILKANVGVNPHSIRHSFASHLIQNGCDVIIVAEFLGHSSLQTTQIYTHVRNKHLQETVINCHPMSTERLHA
ncbi:MAG: integrase [Arcobacter sp.]|nr:MAG: integrase [Arcobacter sp.]